MLESVLPKIHNIKVLWPSSKMFQEILTAKLTFPDWIAESFLA